MTHALNIVLAGSVASVPRQGGWTWVILQYVLGLRRLGHRVLWIDPIAPDALPSSGVPLADSANAAYFRAVARQFGLERDAALVLADASHQTIGASFADVAAAAAACDLLINVSGVLRDEAVLASARRRVYLDLDPAFTQLWHGVQGIDMGFGEHTDFVTIGPAIGTSECPVPSCGVSWTHTVQPIVLERWPVANGVTSDALTTVANWRGYGSIEHRRVVYGQKAHAWRPLLPLPGLTRQRFVLALAIHAGESADLRALSGHGWELLDPADVASTPDRYQQFIRASKGEFGIAKTGYVVSRCGWFSDRSICYLASGRPVIAQDTGFSRYLPTGTGLLAFDTIDQAADAVHDVTANYAAHRAAARHVAEACFDSDMVLASLLERVL